MKRCPEARVAALEGFGPTEEAHARACPACAKERAELTLIKELADQLLPGSPAPSRIGEIRNVLVALPSRSGPRLYGKRAMLVASVAALAIAGFIYRVVQSPPREVHFERALVESDASAQFVHTPGRAQRPEVVRLDRGRIHLAVEPLRARERFLVVTDDAEIEVRGTEFDVVAEERALSAVFVKTGVVEVRFKQELPIVLRAGQSWQPAPPLEPRQIITGTKSAELPPPKKRSISKPRLLKHPAVEESRPKAETSSVAQIPPHERAFRDAWAAFARGDMQHAADLFARAIEAAPSEALAEDSCFGLCMALDRSGRHPEAIVEMRRFLTRYPESVRSDEIALALGWLLLESGELEEASQRFERATKSPVPRVRDSANRGREEAIRRAPR